ncbi:MAG: 2-C-methyl-D-erythritol 4-phosphate cytidylyltransferase, partial [Phycisphaeraceae bacterium]|nr:2-C-methyl-D-erythritol 4-phosphate cytidylyltransferase [Phycisphaeraceae bacterium]
MEPDFAGVIVAAGRSTRFGGSLPKQYRQIAGRSVLEHAVRCIEKNPAVGGVVVVLAASEMGGEREATVRAWPGVTDVVEGGATRSDSVRRGLDAVQDFRFVLIHDAARPVARAPVVAAVVEATRRHGAAIPTVEVTDTVKRVDDEDWIVGTVDRASLRLAQTPQGFRVDWIVEALEHAGATGVTDEGVALERAGRRVARVDGDPDNLKITSAADLERARGSLEGVSMDLRVGTGFDIHRRGGDRPLTLGGVVFEGEVGLVGHSDADVVYHAAMDAVLGAASMGDIGEHFPPDDPRFAGADSGELAATVADRIGEAGFEIVNLDLMLLAETPKIRPRVEEMQAAIAASFGLEAGRVGLKATTLESLGALGRGEGIACQSVALLRRRTDVAR